MGYNRRKRYKGRGRGGSNNNGNRRQRGGGGASIAVVDMTIRPLEINEETRWKPRHLSSDVEDSESSDTHDARLVLLLLNKLTPHNFDKLVSTFVSQGTIQQSNPRMMDTITAIMDRACLDERFTSMYAHLCKRLTCDLIKGTNETVLFRDLLLSHCRESIQPPVNESSDDSQEDVFEHPDEKRVRLAVTRHCYVGSQRFIGELYNSGVFSLSETLSIVEMHLNQVESTDIQEHDRKELALEGLCVLLDACGKRLDENALKYCEWHRCWAFLQDMLDNDECETRTGLTFRMKCMVLDLIELRESGWTPKRYSARQRKEEMVAKPLECHHREAKVGAGNSNRSSKRGTGRKGKTVRFKQQPKK